MKLTAHFGNAQYSVSYSGLTPIANPITLSVTLGASRTSVEAKASEMTASYDEKQLAVIVNPPIARQISGDIYDGEYEVTPGQSPVILSTAGKTMARSVTVNPIPSNYGLITWNGSTLTVS